MVHQYLLGIDKFIFELQMFLSYVSSLICIFEQWGFTILCWNQDNGFLIINSNSNSLL
jgi:hypothetical protein